MTCRDCMKRLTKNLRYLPTDRSEQIRRPLLLFQCSFLLIWFHLFHICFYYSCLLFQFLYLFSFSLSLSLSLSRLLPVISFIGIFISVLLEQNKFTLLCSTRIPCLIVLTHIFNNISVNKCLRLFGTDWGGYTEMSSVQWTVILANGSYEIQRLLKAWVVSHPEYVYWQGPRFSLRSVSLSQFQRRRYSVVIKCFYFHQRIILLDAFLWFIIKVLKFQQPASSSSSSFILKTSTFFHVKLGLYVCPRVNHQPSVILNKS